MFNFDKDRIFNESPKKKLVREYNALKQDYNKINAMKYKALYENAPMSFILENSRYIFSEPIQGYKFYKQFITESVLPLGALDVETQKISEYLAEHSDRMSDSQKDMYSELLTMVESMADAFKISSAMYDNIMEDTESVMELYDTIYEMKNDAHSIDLPSVMEECSDSINILDAVNIGLQVPEITSGLYSYLESAYVDEPVSIDAYMLNAYTSNVLNRMMKDRFFSEAVSNLDNMNLRTLILGLSKLDNVDMLKESFAEDIIVSQHSSIGDAINSIYETAIDEIDSEDNDAYKATNMLFEKCMVDMSNAFAIIDYMSSDADRAPTNNMIIEECVATGNLENPPQTYEDYISLFESRSQSLQEEILNITEKYFSPDGKASSVIAKSVGSTGVDTVMGKSQHPIQYVPLSVLNNKDKVPDDEDDEPEHDKNDDGKNPNDPDTKSESDKDDSDDEKDEQEKRDEAKKRHTEKYANMELDDADNDFLDAYSEKFDDKIPEMPIPPEKPNIFRRIQNKALDANVRFKRRWANKRRTAQDARNAGKAIAKVPGNITTSIKKTVDEWDTYDDDRRKEYIIKPGTRKKYFRALKLCILHYGAFAINPVLNIVLFICQKMGKSKDVRIRNELIRELEAEIKVTEEKIEDAKANNDNKQKYALMRIRDKLSAEVTRVQANSTAL